MTRILQAAFLAVLAATACLAQQGKTAEQAQTSATTTPPEKGIYVGKAIGKATVDRSPSYTTINLYANENVLTDTTNHLHVISRGNTIIFTPNSNFHTRVNAFQLDSGGTKVASYTGMTAYLPDCFSVSPVDPNLLTLYEVDWLQDKAALVYARSQDVKIQYYANGAPRYNAAPETPTRDWVLKEGHYARIPDVPGCRPILYIGPEPVMTPEIAAIAVTVGGPTTALIIWDHKPKASQDSP